jgi:nucleotide-binding universal stress UspA family protein
MYTRILVPLDGSTTAEKVLPYARFLARYLKLPVDLLKVIDVAEIGQRISHQPAEFLKTFVEKMDETSEKYLRVTADTFADTLVKCTVLRGIPAETIIDKAAEDPGTLISMATHGHSGIKRWLLGSVTEKVLRAAKNPLLVIRATEEAKREGEAKLGSVIVPLDGSELAEKVIPALVELAKKLNLETILFRAYTIPPSAAIPDPEITYVVADEELISALREEATAYLNKKAAELKELGVRKVSTVAEYGFGADEIISLARKTPDNLIAMCSHGHSGVKRWVVGSVTETVVRHSGDPVLVIRAI